MSHRPTSAAALVCALVTLGAALAAGPAAAAGVPRDRQLRADLVHLAARAGGTGGFAVLDGATGRTLAASGDRRVRPLGSTAKLLTTGAAIDLLGPGATLATSVVTGAAIEAGTLVGDLVLRGGGDPTLDEPQLAQLADAVQRAGIRVVTGSVVGDESAFDAARGGPPTSGAFDPDLTGSLGALTYARGRQAPGGPLQVDPGRAAAFRFDDVLEARGVLIRGTPRVGLAPAVAVELGRVATPVVAVVKTTNKLSDDFLAEILAKDIGLARGSGGTTAAGAAAIAAHAAGLGATLAPVDGSGVDRRTRGSARQLARYVRRLRTRPAIGASLPVAGVDGTLAQRMRSGRARKACRAKTGSLPATRVSALAGWCRSGGRTIVFAFLREQVASQEAAKAAEDAMVQRLMRAPG
jgi:D-alanyl-D-alanine carboxypeptidase/D-alanyl-D-alanine-endopeptidase (penicillin-binding protein 4)